MSHRNHRKHTRKHILHRRTPPGTPPGTLLADPNLPRPVVKVFCYGPDQYEELAIQNLNTLKNLVGKRPVTWVDVVGLGDAQAIAQIGQIFGLHRLALEDVLNVHQRPKVDHYPDYLFMVSRMVTPGINQRMEQVSFFLGKGFLLTFQEQPGDCLDSIRERIRKKLGRVRDAGADYLAYALLDAILDGYFPVMEEIGERIETLEEEIITHPEQLSISHIHDLKHHLLDLRRAMWPQRDVLNILVRDPHPLITDETRIYFRDGYDHAIQIIDFLETYRELGADMMDLFLSMMSNRMNEVMKVLTIIATIFIPMTLVAGIYGMNFDTKRSPFNMPELNWFFGYPFALLLMGMVATAFLIYFHRRGWIRILWPKKPVPVKTIKGDGQ